MTDLIAFLTARLDEDEQVARAAASVEPPEGEVVVSFSDLRMATHAARHNPARVLREVAAKRAIMARHADCDDVSYGDPSTCPDMRSLVLPYSDHPDFDPAWA